MKLLITGGLGHIGSALINELARYKKIDEICIIDNLLTERYCSLLAFKNKNKIKFIESSIQKFDFKKLNKKYSAVIHLAATTNAEKSFENQKSLYNNNFNATKKIVRYCSIHKVFLIFSSSTSVYGINYDKINSLNNMKNLKPQSPYADCKIKEEIFIRKNLRNFCILRFGTILGISPGMRFHTAINKFCYQASHNLPITIWKKFYDFHRPYLVLSDCIRSIIFVLNKRKLTKNKTIDVVSQNSKLSSIIEIIKKKKKIKIDMVNTKILNQKSYKVESDFIKKLKFIFKGNLEIEIFNLLKYIGTFKK